MNPSNVSNPYKNNITRRNQLLAESILFAIKGFDARSISTNMASANIKALRLFRHICRLIPFIIKIH